ncbi:UDP-2,4-diacetamido-2,4,6-trideoxy-beta-L-altropyranose hydrolase [Sphingomonas sp.]|uniref:UDP-2,4-diacetamido-2,4, 6-trideoxy-beta-L-altropyranose hydrolase n=1 Tax=Sphingomonas sp. TaxID=28214 RepID=UPI00257D2BEF|nr:UDP-2,4-diacetamido-2,4,6-trideoxy-beta-L-altropyranose hydrolase [Sphingomonas sp.]
MRCDASARIGTGHLRRCLSLADALATAGADPHFVLRRHDPVAERIMAAHRYPVAWLSPPAREYAPAADAPSHAAWAGVTAADDAAETIAQLRDWAPQWVVVDHYAFDASWHLAIADALGCSVLAVDDLGDRAIGADVLLDANAADDHAAKYAGRLAGDTRTLVGPRFAPLAPSYRSAPRYAFDPTVRSVGIFMGGMDEHDASGAALRTLRREVGFAGAVEIVTTATARHVEALARACADDGNAVLSVDLPDLSAFYARHDLQIGAGGTSSYERACIGVPTIAVVLAENQLTVVPILSRLGIVLGATMPDVAATGLLAGAEDLARVATDLIAVPDARRAMAERSQQLVDGRGAERVALSLMADGLTLRPAVPADAAMLHAWRDDPSTRAVSTNRGAIAYADHLAWFAGVLASPTRRLFVAMVGALPVGAIRFDLNEDEAWEISLYTDPALQGMGLGKRMLEAGEAAIVGADDRGVVFHARVEPGNRASMRMFERASYRARPDRLYKVRGRETER